jgi:hypothetical protein
MAPMQRGATDDVLAFMTAVDVAQQAGWSLHSRKPFKKTNDVLVKAS